MKKRPVVMEFELYTDLLKTEIIEALGLMRFKVPLSKVFHEGYNLPLGTDEYRFDQTRRWKFDCAWPHYKVAVEMDGVSGLTKDFQKTIGRHQREEGMSKDNEKINSATIWGWIVLRFTTKAITSALAIEQIKNALKSRGWQG